MLRARAAYWALAMAAASGFTTAASAQQQTDNPLKSVMKMLGFATDVGAPADFVLKTRPEKEPDFIPVFQAPPEPARPALKDKDLGALKGDLDSVQTRADAVRAAFPPSAKSVADQKTQAAQAKKTPPPGQ